MAILQLIMSSLSFISLMLPMKQTMESLIKHFGPLEEEPGVKITIVFVNLQHSQKRQRTLAQSAI